MLKQFLRGHVYVSEVLLDERRRAAAMLGELFEFFLGHPDHLPPSYREQASGQPLHRIVCDYIAGMTDGFFHRTYQQLLGGRI